MNHILIVDDDITFTIILKKYLERKGYETDTAHSVIEASEKISKNTYQLLLLDYHLEDGNGLDIAAMVNRTGSKIPIIIMTSYNDVRLAVKAMKMGVYDYITKPVNQEELLMVVEGALQSTLIEGNKPKPIRQETSTVQKIVYGNSTAWKKLYEQVMLVAPTELSTLILGESGTGKENIARMIHKVSARSKGPFVAIDCGTLSRELAGSELFGHVKGSFTGATDNKKGKLEWAEGGTVFLDEIGNLGYDVQVKLLRALQERAIQPIGSNIDIHIDVRIIAASNEDLRQNALDGVFREDLYHRLNEFTLRVPPLRERIQDFPLFIDFFLEEANRTMNKQVNRISEEVMELFEQYHWPGNIRELKNILRRMVLLCKGHVAGKECLPEEMFMGNPTTTINATNDLKALKELNEKEMIEKVLREVQFNKTKAAIRLNIDRSTLYAKMSKFGLH